MDRWMRWLDRDDQMVIQIERQDQQIDGYIYIDSQLERQIDRWIDGQMDRNGQMDRWIKMDRWIDRQMDRDGQMNRDGQSWIDGYLDRKIGLVDRWIDRQIND